MFNELSLDLTLFLEENEHKVLVYKVADDKCSIYPSNSKGDATQEDAQPALVYRIDKANNCFIVSWIYLISKNRGLGTEIIKKIIKFCEINNIKKLMIKGVEEENILMNSLCAKFGFVKIETSTCLINDFQLLIK